MDFWLLFLCILLTDFNRISCLLVTDISVPEIVDFRDNVTLTCHYNMKGHTLNSVKWYKDKNEFFRYSPMMLPVYLKFPVEGIEVQDSRYFCNESKCTVDVVLDGAKSTGVYKCEVSGDAPHFKLAARAANMTVAALPQTSPLIDNFGPIYRMEDFVSAVCTSDYTSLPTKLSWYINGEQALMPELQPLGEQSISAHDYIMRRQKLQVNFYLNGPRFYHAGKTLELKCVADIESFPELRREHVLTATLMQYDNLNNQMLIHAGSGGIPGSASVLHHASGFSSCFVIFLFISCVCYL